MLLNVLESRFPGRMHELNPLDDQQARDALRRIFDAAVESAAPAKLIPQYLPDKPAGRCVVVGAGKASAAMAAALDAAWPDVDISGVVSTRYGHAVDAGRIVIIEAGHPVPDANSEQAAKRIFDAVRNLSPDDLVIALISGGGSATMALPIESLSLADKQDITRQLLASGANIGEMNAVRKHLSRIKGGKLAAAIRPARLCTLLISDVPGDDPASVASGPTLPCVSSPSDALAIIDRYNIRVPETLRRHLVGSDGPTADTGAGEHRIIASPSMALTAAAQMAGELGLAPAILGDAIEGESRELGCSMASMALSMRSPVVPSEAPVVLLSGGETTVTIGAGGAGRGGRNTEFLLSLAIALDGERGIWALAGDSDGIDGTDDAAGAIITPDTLSRAAAAGLNAGDFLQRHDSYSFFDVIGDLVVTGPTLTNVNDIRLVLVNRPR
ncbi:MAG TPA: glycerate kinase [Woeseiaceae bacterium]|nr:glycerate kinase [Woeseiaceae bacterium]